MTEPDVSDTALVVAADVTKRFKERRLWSGLSFTVEPGQMMAVLGQSGSGKTTLLNCIGALDTIDDGLLTVDGLDVRRLAGRNRRRFFRQTVGFLFQNYALIDSWTVSRNLDVALDDLRGRPKEKRRQKSEMLERLGLANVIDQPVYSLSGGEQQRVALARLMLKEARVLLVDEPTSALDDRNAALLAELLLERCAGGAAVVISTHDPRVITHSHSTLRLTETSRENARVTQ